MRKIGAILPGGNEPEFPDIRDELRQRGVVWFERSVCGGNATVFWFFESELPKLPVDTEPAGSSTFEQYLPADEESGHGIAVLDRYLEANPGKDVECPA